MTLPCDISCRTATDASVAVQWIGAVSPIAFDADGLAVIGMHRPPGMQRPEARQAVRQALSQVLAGFLGVPIGLLSVTDVRGTPPKLCMGGAPMATPGMSITYTPTAMLAAVRRGGSVGIDAMQVETFEGIEAVATEYLGLKAAKEIARLPPAERTGAFAHAWTTLEATLKCQGRGLEERGVDSDPVIAAKLPVEPEVTVRRVAPSHDCCALNPEVCATVVWMGGAARLAGFTS